jgi:acetyl-CoA acetyltransferase
VPEPRHDLGAHFLLVAASLVQAGVHRRVLCVAFEKPSESHATWALTPNMPFQPPVVAGAGGYFTPHIRAYMKRSGAPDCTHTRLSTWVTASKGTSFRPRSLE